MSPRMLEAIERVLMAALAVILALGVWNAFLRVIETSETGEVQTTDDPAAAGTTVTPRFTRISCSSGVVGPFAPSTTTLA